MSEEYYRHKYLKYKNKYLELKALEGGVNPFSKVASSVTGKFQEAKISAQAKFAVAKQERAEQQKVLKEEKDKQKKQYQGKLEDTKKQIERNNICKDIKKANDNLNTAQEKLKQPIMNNYQCDDTNAVPVPNESSSA